MVVALSELMLVPPKLKKFIFYAQKEYLILLPLNNGLILENVGGGAAVEGRVEAGVKAEQNGGGSP